MEQQNIKNLIRVRPIESYSKDALQEIHLISFTERGAIPFGSSVYVIQKYPGDIDTYEQVLEEGPPARVINDIAERMKEVVIGLISHPCHVISDIKAGVDKEFDINIGTLIRGKWDTSTNLSSILPKISAADREQIGVVLSAATDDATKYDGVNKIIREYRIIRWTPQEVAAGSKIKNGHEITLQQALSVNSQVKIDSISIIDGKFVETTNQLYLGSIDPITEVVNPINTSFDFTNKAQVLLHYEDSLRGEIEKLFYSKVWYSPFKGAKRMWAFSRVFSRDPFFGKILEKLTPIISGDISLLYSIKSEIETILLALNDKSFYKCVKKLLPTRIDTWKVAISHIPMLNNQQMISLLDTFSLGVSSDIDNIKVRLENSSSIIKKIINETTISQMKDHHLFPIPLKFLPEIPAYHH